MEGVERKRKEKRGKQKVGIRPGQSMMQVRIREKENTDEKKNKVTKWKRLDKDWLATAKTLSSGTIIISVYYLEYGVEKNAGCSIWDFDMSSNVEETGVKVQPLPPPNPPLPPPSLKDKEMEVATAGCDCCCCCGCCSSTSGWKIEPSKDADAQRLWLMASWFNPSTKNDSVIEKFKYRWIPLYRTRE